MCVCGPIKLSLLNTRSVSEYICYAFINKFIFLDCNCATSDRRNLHFMFNRVFNEATPIQTRWPTEIKAQ